MEELTLYNWTQIASTVIIFIVAIITTAMAFVQNKHDKAISLINRNTEKYNTIQEGFGNRITTLESQEKQKLSREHHLSIIASISELRAQINGVSRLLNMLHEHQLNQSK